MSLIHWLSGLFSKLISTSSTLPTVTKHRTRFRSPIGRLKAIGWMTAASVALALMSSATWAEELSATKGTIVAAGLGYQSGNISTITVKVYDAVSGDVLSDETFELNVKEERSAKGTTPQERIFAGGVGLGATDLSNFVLRVYDAKTGRFQWEGQLNLTPIGEGGAGQVVSTLIPRRATITKIHDRETTARQPSFLLRALDPSTGGLLWEDEFSTDNRRAAGIERIAGRLSGRDAQAPHTFDFRIRMFDGSGTAILWEDQFAQEEAEEESRETADDQAHMLPAWPRLLQQAIAPEAI